MRVRWLDLKERSRELRKSNIKLILSVSAAMTILLVPVIIQGRSDESSSRLVYLPKNHPNETEKSSTRQLHLNDTGANQSESKAAEDNNNNNQTLIDKTVVYDPLGETEFDEPDEVNDTIDRNVDRKIPLETLVQFDYEQQEHANGQLNRPSRGKLSSTQFDDIDALNLTSFYERRPKVANKTSKTREQQQQQQRDYYHRIGRNGSFTTGSRRVSVKPAKIKDRWLREQTGLDHYKAQGSYLMESSEKNTFQVANLCAMQLSSSPGVCITYGAVESAVQAARRVISFGGLPGDLDSLEPSERTINTIGELIEWTTRILAAQFGLSSDEIALDMSQIDIRQTSLWRTCPRIFRSMPFLTCPLSRYRTYNGECNNLASPHLGATYMPFVRQLLPQYGDSVGAPRVSCADKGAALPPARLVALHLHPDLNSASADESVLFTAWGQLVNHDLALAAGARRK